MSKRYPYNRRMPNVTQLLGDRAYYNIEAVIKNRLQSAPNLIRNLELDAILRSHNGCVNCLEWNSTGKILASGSDDLHIVLWDPFRKRRILKFLTPHHGNIFSVKFLPCSGDGILASGAADGQLFAYDIKQADVVPIWKCHCHHSRVKRLATAPETPFVFWSVGEDGNVMQFDIREHHDCRGDTNVLLVGLQRYMGPNAEAKCIAINPRRPELLAIGANDVYARLYDRRMISLEKVNYRLDQFSSPSETTSSYSDYPDNVPMDCVTYFCPGHLNKSKSQWSGCSNKAVTYLAFSPDGNELLVNMGAEQIYLYDVIGGKQPVFLDLPPLPPKNSDNGSGDDDAMPAQKRKLPSHVDAIKKAGNDYLENEKYLPAIYQYNEAINCSPNYPVLYLNRATALMRRKWYGDTYAGLRDCRSALRMDPTYVKAHFRLARALLELGLPQEAQQCLNELKTRFPSHANNNGVTALTKDIEVIHSNHISLGGWNNFLDQLQQFKPDNGLLESPISTISEHELYWRSSAIDYKERFVGHCNTTTDIKEANFFGNDGNYVIAGSDDGNFFIWERTTGMITNICKADSAIVNCVQPNPYTCLLATSGIDHEVLLWSPKPDQNYEAKHTLDSINKIAVENQTRMQQDAFDMTGSGTICRSS